VFSNSDKINVFRCFARRAAFLAASNWQRGGFMRFSSLTGRVLLIFAAAVLASCGGGSSSTTPSAPTSIATDPTSFSLTHGDVIQFNSVQVLDSTNTAITPTPAITYTSSNTNVVTVSSAGLVCAGIFDASNVVCQTSSNGTPLPDASANITVASSGLTSTVPVFVHAHVDNIAVAGPSNSPVCVSQNQTEQFSAQAFSGGTDITSKVGAFSWTSGTTAVGTVDANGVVTAKGPGATTVVASVGSTTGTPATFIGCPPKTISLHVTAAADTTFSVAAGGTASLTADVTDILNRPISNAALTFSSYVPTAATSTTAGAVTAPGAGKTTIVASCTPPNCNPASGPNLNLNGTGAGLAVYSNPVIGTVTGSTATTIYVTGKDNPDGSANTSLIPIDSGTNTAGTAITLPGSPNSMVFNRAGTKAYLGSTVGLILFDVATNAVTASVSSVTGTVLAVSPDGVKVIVSDTAASPARVFVFDTSASTQQSFALAGVTAADFAPDNSKAFLTNGSTVYEFSVTSGLKTLTFAGSGVAFAPQASVAYFGGASMFALAACNDARVDNATGITQVLAPTLDGTHMIGAGTAGWVDLSLNLNNATGCPPTATNTVRSATLPAFVTTPSQVSVASDDSFAYLTGFSGATVATGLPFFKFSDGTSGSIQFTGAGGQVFSGGITQDARSLYVGVGGSGGVSPQVHRLDLVTAGFPFDAQQISVTFNPRIVVVRPK
jgi:hypothetical protein